MQEVRSAAQEAAEDIFFGQLVIIWARWFVIAAIAILTLWTATSVSAIQSMTLFIILLMAINFFVHGRYVLQRPANQTLIILLSLLDLIIITGIVLTWPGQRGLANQFFVFYFPMVLAVGFVFPRRIEVVYTALALSLYGVACLLSSPSILGDAIAGGLMTGVGPLKTLVLRLIALGAMGGLANYYFRIQRGRRRALVAPPAMPQAAPIAMGPAS